MDCNSPFRTRVFPCVLALLLFQALGARADSAAATVAAGTNPIAVAVNPVTNKIYVANSSSGTQGESP